MRIRRTIMSLLASVWLAATLVAPALGAQPPVLVADLEGRPIPASSAANYFCHDFNFPLIHCYQTDAALEAAVAPFVAGNSSGELTSGAIVAGYVKVFEFSSYAGTSFYISQDYSRLADIGWNDRISSYRVTDASGSFYTDMGYAGAVDYYCCRELISSMHSTYDNRLSSVLI